MSGLTKIQQLLEGTPFDLTISFKGSGEVAYKCFLPDDWGRIDKRLSTADELVEHLDILGLIEEYTAAKLDDPDYLNHLEILKTLHVAYLKARDTK